MPTSDYRNEKGERLPSVTQIIERTFPKPGLIEWANREGLAGRSHTVVRDQMAKVGTLAHERFFAEVGGPAALPTDESIPQGIQDKASMSVHHARQWFADLKEWDAILVEQPLVHHRHGFGGTPDWYGRLDLGDGPQLTVLDLKTGRSFPEHAVQLGGYVELLRASGHDVEQAIALYAPRSMTGSAKHIRWKEDTLETIDRAWRAVCEVYSVRMVIG